MSGITDDKVLQLMLQEWLRGLRRKPLNSRCMDCGLKDPTFVCLDFNTFICSSCSSLHREFNFQVKPITTSHFTTEEVKQLEDGGNALAWKTWLANWTHTDYPEPDHSDVVAVREFIKLKYIGKHWHSAEVEKETQLRLLKKTQGLTVFLVGVFKVDQVRQTDLGITHENIIFVDLETKAAQSYSYSQLRRHVAAENALTFDFGEHSTEYYKLNTPEAEEIANLIKEYTALIVLARATGKQDAMEIFQKKQQMVRIKVPNGSVEAILLPESLSLRDCINRIAGIINVSNADEFSLQKDDKWVKEKMLLGELDLDKEDLLVLKQKFFTETTLSPADPNLNNIYEQCRDNVISGTHPTIREEAIELAALQCQVSFGDCNELRTQGNWLNLRDFLPPAYQKVKGVEKKIAKDYQRFNGLSSLVAKYQYIKTCRYGTLVWAVKIGEREAFFAVNFDRIMFLDGKTKKITKQFDFTQIKRWLRPNENSATFDFGELGSLNICSPETEYILQMVYGYLELYKKRNGKALESVAAPAATISSGPNLLDMALGSISPRNNFPISPRAPGPVTPTSQSIPISNGNASTSNPGSPMSIGSPTSPASPLSLSPVSPTINGPVFPNTAGSLKTSNPVSPVDSLLLDPFFLSTPTSGNSTPALSPLSPVISPSTSIPVLPPPPGASNLPLRASSSTTISLLAPPPAPASTVNSFTRGMSKAPSIVVPVYSEKPLIQMPDLETSTTNTPTVTTTQDDDDWFSPRGPAPITQAVPSTPKSITPPTNSMTASGGWWGPGTAATSTPVQAALSSLPATTPTFSPDFSAYTPTTTPTSTPLAGNRIGSSHSHSSPNLMGHFNPLSHSAPLTPSPYPMSPLVASLVPLSNSQNVTSNHNNQYPPLSLSTSAFKQDSTANTLNPSNISNLSSSGSYGMFRAVSSSSLNNSAPSTPKMVSSSSFSNIPRAMTPTTPLQHQNSATFQPNFNQQPILQPQILQPQTYSPQMAALPVLPMQNFAPQNYPGPQSFGQPQLNFQPNFQQFPNANLQQQFQAQQKLVDDRFGDAFL